GASGGGPAHLGLDVAHARDGDLEPLADMEIGLGVDPAAFVGEVAEPDRLLAAVGPLNDRLDLDGMTVLTPRPCLRPLHHDCSHSAAPLSQRAVNEELICGELAPKSGGDGVGLDFAAQIEAARLDPRQLARTGAGQGPRRNELDDRRDSGDRPDSLADLVAKPAALLIAGDPAVDEDGRGLLAARPGDRESGDVARLEARELLDRPFDVLRPMIAPVDDDHVLGAADDEDVALRHIAHVAGVEPTVGAQAGA